MRENRHLTRWRLIYSLRVLDRATGALLGHVVDINVEGMMLVSAGPIALDREYDVRMVLPSASGEADEVALRVRALWRGTDPNSDFHNTGFRLVDPPQDTVLRVRELIEDLRFPGSGEPAPAAQADAPTSPA